VVFYITMTYKKTSTTLAIAVIAALMVSASVVVALTIITEGVGISHAGAKPQRAHICHNTGLPGPPCKPPLRAKP
jgi:hypothetical protein